MTFDWFQALLYSLAWLFQAFVCVFSALHVCAEQTIFDDSLGQLIYSIHSFAALILSITLLIGFVYFKHFVCNFKTVPSL